MAQISIHLDALKILSTANPSPYWDEVLVWVNVKIDSQVIASAYSTPGTYGAGAVVPLDSFSVVHGTWPATFSDQDHQPFSPIELEVLIQNTRGLAPKDTERLIAGLTIATLGGAASALLPKDLAKEILVLLGAGKGLVGGAIGKLLDKLFKDRPVCIGEMGEFDIDFTLQSLLNKPFAWEVFRQNFTSSTQRGTWKNSETSLKRVVGVDCGQAQVSLYYSIAIENTTTIQGAGKTALAYVPQTVAPLDAWFGAWGEAPGPGRLYFSIERGSLPMADVLRITSVERLQSISGEAIADFGIDNETIELGYHLSFGQDTWARRGKFAGLVSNSLNTPISKLASGSGGKTMSSSSADITPFTESPLDTELALSHKQSTMALSESGSMASISDRLLAPSLIAIATSELSNGFDLHRFMDQALTVFIPSHNITLALYKAIVTDAVGKILSEAYVVRYSRAASVHATQTDVIVGRPIKLN